MYDHRRLQYGQPPFFTVCLHIYCQYKFFIISSLFHFIHVLVAMAMQSYDGKYIQENGWGSNRVKDTFGIVAPLDPTKYLQAYKLPHHEQKN